MSTAFLTPDRRRFVDEMAALLVPWALPQAAGRVFAYLLLCPEPASLDDIAADLELAKSSASVTARLLERHGMAVRHSVAGSKRALYGPPSNPAGLILDKARGLEAMAKLLQTRAPTVATGPAAARLDWTATYCLKMRDAIEAVVQQLDGQAGEPRT